MCPCVWNGDLAPGWSGPGRAQAGSVTPGSARAVLEGLEWYWPGGSHHFGRVHRSSGPLHDPG